MNTCIKLCVKTSYSYWLPVCKPSMNPEKYVLRSFFFFLSNEETKVQRGQETCLTPMYETVWFPQYRSFAQAIKGTKQKHSNQHCHGIPLMLLQYGKGPCSSIFEFLWFLLVCKVPNCLKSMQCKAAKISVQHTFLHGTKGVDASSTISFF